VIAFLLLSGDPPFGGCGGPEPLMQVRANILSGNFSFEPVDIWENVSVSAREFIKDTLVIDPTRRPTAKQAQKHDWLQQWASRERKTTDNVLNPNVVRALVNFKEYSDMRKLLCEVLSFTMLPDQIKELRSEFEKMDTDGSGEISLAALKEVLMTNAGAGSLGALTEEEVEDVFNAMRVRKADTRIHWHEFIAAGLSQCQVDDRNLRLAFERLDSDHKGVGNCDGKRIPVMARVILTSFSCLVQYITLDDIMDLMGSDGLQSEEALRQMWGDSTKAVHSQGARITYTDFLLLMKGQTKDSTNVTKLDVVHEIELMESKSESDTPSSQLRQDEEQLQNQFLISKSASHTPSRIPSIRSAPSTPVNHKPIAGAEDAESPFVLGADIAPGLLVPPLSPRHILAQEGLLEPSIAARPDGYKRRSQSIDEKATSPLAEGDSLVFKHDFQLMADAVNHLTLPETDHEHHDQFVHMIGADGSKSNIQVNRTLYRAHRHMRLAVMEASKNFEEQRAAHARDVLLARNAEEEKIHKQAGLVLRHGMKKQVSSEAVRKFLQDDEQQQQELVAKATKISGRVGGKRSQRTKTISDMTAMMSSMDPVAVSALSQKPTGASSSSIGASADQPAHLPLEGLFAGLPTLPPSIAEDKTVSSPDNGAETPVNANGGTEVNEEDIRRATVPGDFRRTADPFGDQGRYGNLVRTTAEIEQGLSSSS
jgi:Ca2+-binding EF-hand superfamily protein